MITLVKMLIATLMKMMTNLVTLKLGSELLKLLGARALVKLRLNIISLIRMINMTMMIRMAMMMMIRIVRAMMMMMTMVRMPTKTKDLASEGGASFFFLPHIWSKDSVKS